jgi:hypothetical protein
MGAVGWILRSVDNRLAVRVASNLWITASEFVRQWLRAPYEPRGRRLAGLGVTEDW